MDLLKIAECPVCLKLFTEPKVLGCGHCVCKKCIKAAPRGLTGQLKVNCPECRQESSVPVGGFPTIYRLLDIVSNLESSGFRNAKDCVGCGRKTPKAELFSCISCQEELGNAQEVIICSLCCMKAHKTHAVVDFNKATSRDVQQARDKIERERDTTQQQVARVRSQLEEMTQEVMQALDARVPRHDELRAQLGVENVSKDDIKAKLAQSETNLAETVSIADKMRDSIERCGRSLMAHVQQDGSASQAATARPAADQPTTSASPLAVLPIQMSLAPGAGTVRRLADAPERSVSSWARATAPARSLPPRRQATPARPRRSRRTVAKRNTLDRINAAWGSYERSASLFPAADGAASSSGTAASRNVPQEPARGRSPPRDPRRKARRTYAGSSEEEDNDYEETTARASLAMATKRARRDSGN